MLIYLEILNIKYEKRFILLNIDDHIKSYIVKKGIIKAVFGKKYDIHPYVDIYIKDVNERNIYFKSPISIIKDKFRIYETVNFFTWDM